MPSIKLRALLGFPLVEAYRGPVEEELCAYTLRVGRFVCPVTMVSQAVMMAVMGMREGGPFFSTRRTVYFLLYLALLCATLLFFLAALAGHRWGRLSAAAALRMGVGYSAILCLWACAVTANDQFGGNGLNVYIYVLLSVAAFAVVKPWQGVLLFGGAFTLLNCLLPLTPSGQENLFNNLVNSAFITGLSLSLSAYLYRSRVFAAHGRMVIQRQNEKLNRVNRQLHVLASTDQLTGMHNRRYLEEIIGSRLCRSEAEGLSVSGLMLDIDFFKQYNDKYGHQAGDVCLQRIAGVLLSLTESGVCAVRYGGEEFFLCLFGADEAGAVALAEELRSRVEGLDICHEDVSDGRVTVSVGLCHIPAGACVPLPELVRQADEALYRAKRDGRNRIRLWSPEEKTGPLEK